MQTINKHKTKILTGCVALFALVAIFVGSHAFTQKAQACATNCFPPVSGYCIADINPANIGQTVTFTVHPDGGSGLYVYNWSGTDGLTGTRNTVSKAYSTSGTKTATVLITSNGQSVSKSCTVVIKSAGCDNTCFPPVSGFCDANVSQADINQTVTYTVHPSGGSGLYVYNWSGTDGLTGTRNTVSKAYSTSGTKTATVLITSNGQSVSASCHVVITQPIVQNLNVFCVANPTSANIGDTVVFTATVSGGNGNYSYTWTGDEGLFGNSQTVYKTYTLSGTKNATVTVTSDGQSVSASCNVVVNNSNSNLSVYCVANPTSANINQLVTFTAYPTGGTSFFGNLFNSYNYTWTGTDGLYGNSQTVSKTYQYGGTKSATVTVTINGQSVSATCNTNIQDVPIIYPPQQPPQQGVFLDTIPATGIAPSVKTALFMSGMVIWSAFLGYIYIRRRNLKFAEQKMIEDAMNS